MTLDLIIHGGYVITMEGPQYHGAGHKGQNRRSRRRKQDDDIGTAHRYIAAKGKAVMPGFVNVHMHTGGLPSRSCAYDLPGKIRRFKASSPFLGWPDDFMPLPV